MVDYYITLELESDATFSRGDGIAGMLNQEVQHDEYGCPYISGKTLKGLLVASCAEIMMSLKKMNQDAAWCEPAGRLFGKAGSSEVGQALMHVGDAKLPWDLRQALLYDWVEYKKMRPEEILDSMTAIRSQTKVDEETQAAANGSLRSDRVILKGMYFEAVLVFDDKPQKEELELLSACVKATCRAGSNVSRGRGRLIAKLLDGNRKSILCEYFNKFKEEVLK